MSEKIRVMNIEIDGVTSKEALRRMIACMASEPLSVVDLVTARDLMLIDAEEDLAGRMRLFDLVLPGDAAVLEAAGSPDRGLVLEAKRQRYLRLLLQYLHKNRSRVYVVADPDGAGKETLDYIARAYAGIRLAGISRLDTAEKSDDMLVNAINGAEADCVLAMLDSPAQERFVLSNRNRINARLWVCAGKNMRLLCGEKTWAQKLGDVLIRKFFRREVERRKEQEA